jgi:radical SAM protein with 4Fe4S-binding SPASM domain
VPELELDPQKIYNMPTPIFIESIDGKYLVISRDTANWILLHNNQQLKMFSLLNEGASIANLFTSFSNSKEDVNNDILQVLTELEAKQFENTKILFPQENGMYIYLTNKCNQKCHHCYMYAGNAETDELSTKEIQQILYEFSVAGGNAVTFTGGEAALRQDFIDIVRTAKKLGLSVCILSNGVLWPPELINDVKDFIDEVQISIDGFDSKTYKEIRGVDSFNTALQTVDNLLNAKIRVIIAITPLLKTLLPNKENYSSFAQQLSKKYYNYNLLIKFNTELIKGRNISPTKEENDLYRNVINAIKSECTPFSEEEGFTLNHINSTVSNNCGYGGLCIAANGDVFFCNIISSCAKQANTRTNSFSDIFALSQKARMFSDVSNLYPCKECDLKYLCGGGCRIKHFPELVALSFNDSMLSKVSFTRSTLCNREDKEKIYRLMIASNRLFYRNI